MPDSITPETRISTRVNWRTHVTTHVKVWFGADKSRFLVDRYNFQPGELYLTKPWTRNNQSLSLMYRVSQKPHHKEIVTEVLMMRFLSHLVVQYSSLTQSLILLKPPQKSTFMTYLKLSWNLEIFKKVGFLGGQRGVLGFEPSKMFLYMIIYYFRRIRGLIKRGRALEGDFVATITKLSCRKFFVQSGLLDDTG